MKKLLLTSLALLLMATSAAAQAFPRAGVILLQDQPGGFLGVHEQLFAALGASGNYIEIRGKCLSACTLILAYQNGLARVSSFDAVLRRGHITTTRDLTSHVR
jgi:hypothetical protein